MSARKKTVTIDANFAAMCANALTCMAREQKELGYYYTAASCFEGTAKLLHKLGNSTVATCYEHIAADTVKEARARDAAKATAEAAAKAAS